MTCGRRCPPGNRSGREQLDLQQERPRLATLEGQLAAIDRAIAAEQQTVSLSRRAARAALSEAEARSSITKVSVQYAEDEYRRVGRLREARLVSEADLDRAARELEGRRAELAAAVLGLERLRAEQAATQNEQKERRLGALGATA